MSQDQSTDNVEVEWNNTTFGLEQARAVLDVYDEQLVVLLSKRLKLSTQVVAAKMKAGLDKTDLGREHAMMDRLGELCDMMGLDKTFVNNVMNSITSESKIRGREAHARSTGEYFGVS